MLLHDPGRHCTTLGDTARPWCVLHDPRGVVQHTPRSCNAAPGRAEHRDGASVTATDTIADSDSESDTIAESESDTIADSDSGSESESDSESEVMDADEQTTTNQPQPTTTGARRNTSTSPGARHPGRRVSKHQLHTAHPAHHHNEQPSTNQYAPSAAPPRRDEPG